MFDFVHENKKLVQIVLAVIILPFALWGVSSYDKVWKRRRRRCHGKWRKDFPEGTG